jgi:hypothetical protein
MGLSGYPLHARNPKGWGSNLPLAPKGQRVAKSLFFGVVYCLAGNGPSCSCIAN